MFTASKNEGMVIFQSHYSGYHKLQRVRNLNSIERPLSNTFHTVAMLLPNWPQLPLHQNHDLVTFVSPVPGQGHRLCEVFSDHDGKSVSK